MRKLLNIDCIRKCRTCLRILAEAYAACMLTNNSYWEQLWQNDASRRTVSMTAVPSGVKHSNALRPIMSQCAKVCLGEKSQHALEMFDQTIEEGKEDLTELKNAVETQYPDFEHDAPSLESSSKTNCKQVSCTANACNQACRSHRLIMDDAKKVASDNGSVKNAGY